MNILLVERYICRKLQKTDEIYAFLAEHVGKQEFFSMVLDTKISDLSPEFLSWHRAVIERKFGLPKRRLLFPRPTVRQWIFDLAGEYQPEDVMDFFVQSSGASKAMLTKNNIESTVIDHPFLIDLVDRLEEATGKVLHDPRERDFPLRYLGNVSYLDLADYFSPKGSDKIDAIRRRNRLI